MPTNKQVLIVFTRHWTLMDLETQRHTFGVLREDGSCMLVYQSTTGLRIQQIFSQRLTRHNEFFARGAFGGTIPPYEFKTGRWRGIAWEGIGTQHKSLQTVKKQPLLLSPPQLIEVALHSELRMITLPKKALATFSVSLSVAACKNRI